MLMRLHSTFLLAVEETEKLRECPGAFPKGRALVRLWICGEDDLGPVALGSSVFEIWVRRGRCPSTSGAARRSNCVLIRPFTMKIRFANCGGGGGIRTHGTLRLSGFQDRRNRPLCHPSFVIIINSLIYQANIQESCLLPIYCQLSEFPSA